jgi:hypothetical protein
LKKALLIFFLCCVAAAMVSCGGSSTALVVITQGSQSLPVGQGIQFTANLPVTWTVSGDGTINSAGFFTAGGTPGTATITATSADGKSYDSVTVTVVASGTTTTTTTGGSGLKHRIFVSNSYPGLTSSGALDIVDADTDELSLFTVSVGGSPTFMAQSGTISTDTNKDTVVFDSSSNTLKLVDDTKESLTAQVTLPGPTSSVLVAINSLIAYAAVPTAQVARNSSGNPITGAVYVIQFSSSPTLLPVAVQGAKSITPSYIGVTGTSTYYANLLVFSQSCDTVTALQNGSAGIALTNLGTVNGSPTCPFTDTSATAPFSRPVSAVFTSDANGNAFTAYVLSSGTVNGGASGAKVTQVDMTPTTVGNPPVLPPGSSPVSVPGAQVGLLQGTTLYVAGADPAHPGNGLLSVINTASTLTATTSILTTSLGPGTPQIMVPDTNGNIWVGSIGCTVPQTQSIPGCLAVVVPGSNPTTTAPQVFNNAPSSPLSNASDDITGMVWLYPLNKRTVMYVVEGAELAVYTFDGTNLTQLYTPYLDIVGQAVDVKLAY